MALIVETGAGLASAESLASVVYADAYFLARANAAWAALDTAAKEVALRKATDYLGATYGTRWVGERVTQTQALDWPRYNVPNQACGYYDSTVVPELVKRACCELAVKASSGVPLTVDTSPLATRVKVGPIEKEYAPGTSQVKRYRFVDDMLGPLLGGAGGLMLKVFRA